MAKIQLIPMDFETEKGIEFLYKRFSVIRTHLKNRGISWEDMSSATGIKLETLRSYQKPSGSKPTITNLYALCTAYDINYSYIIDGESPIIFNINHKSTFEDETIPFYADDSLTLKYSSSGNQIESGLDLEISYRDEKILCSYENLSKFINFQVKTFVLSESDYSKCRLIKK